MEDFLGLKWQENPRAGKKKKKKKKSASCIDSVEQARRWKQVTNRTPQQMTLEAAQLQLMGHDHPLFLPTFNPCAFDFNRKPPPFLEGNQDAALKCPFPKEVHGPALGGISSVEPPFISQTQTTDVLAKGSLAQTPEIKREAMLSQRPAQLTIFYGDGVYVYSDITPKKADLIMSMAKDQPTTSSASRARQRLEVANNIHRPRAMYPHGTVPQARRATLVRFLEKRKDRLSSDIYDLIKKSSESSIFPPEELN